MATTEEQQKAVNDLITKHIEQLLVKKQELQEKIDQCNARIEEINKKINMFY